MSDDRELEITAIICECVRIRRVASMQFDVLVGIDEAASRIAALPQPITAETVRQAAHDLICWTYQHCINVDPSEYSRNVKDLHPGVFNLMNESERVLYAALLKENEAIAQRANQGVSHEG